MLLWLNKSVFQNADECTIITVTQYTRSHTPHCTMIAKIYFTRVRFCVLTCNFSERLLTHDYLHTYKTQIVTKEQTLQHYRMD